MKKFVKFEFSIYSGGALPQHMRDANMPGGRYSKRLNRGQNRHGANADWGYCEVHVNVTWRIRLNRPCAAAIRLYVK